MKDETSAAVEWLRDVATLHRKEWLKETARAILAHIADLETRAEKAEARAERAEKCLREPVDNTGDYSHPAWKLRDEQQARAEAAEAREALPADPPAEWIEAMRAEFLKSLETVSAVDLSEEETGEVKLYGGCTPATNYVTIDINDALEAAYAALAQQMGGGDAE